MVELKDRKCYILHQNKIVSSGWYYDRWEEYVFPQILIGVVNNKEYQILYIKPLKFTHSFSDNIHKNCPNSVPEINEGTLSEQLEPALTGTIYSIYINPELQWAQITQAEIDEIFDDIYEAHYPRSSSDKDTTWMPLKWPRACEYTIDGYRYVLSEPYGILASDFKHNYEFASLNFQAVEGADHRTDNIPEGARSFSRLTIVGRGEAEILNRIDSIRLKGHIDVNPSLEAYKEKLGPYEPQPHIMKGGILIYAALMFAVAMFEARILGWSFLTIFFVAWLRTKPDFWLWWYRQFGKRIQQDVDEEIPFEKPKLFRREIDPKEARKKAKEKQGY